MGYTTNDQAICAFQSETSYGTDAFAGGAPPDTAVMAAVDLQITPQIALIEGDRLTATVAGECHSTVFTQNDVALTMPFLGPAALGEPSPLAPIFKAANLAEVLVADTSSTYFNVTENNASTTPSMTALHYQRSVEDNTARRIMARGTKFNNLTFNFVLGAEGLVTAAGAGLYDAWPNASAALPTLPEEYSGDMCGWPVNAMAVTLGGTVYPVEMAEISTNYTLEVIKTGDATGGGIASRILLVKPKSGGRSAGSMELADGNAALADAIAKSKSGAKAALSITLTKNGISGIFTGTVQLGMLANAAPRFTVPFYFVRPDGASGAGGDFQLTYVAAA